MHNGLTSAYFRVIAVLFSAVISPVGAVNSEDPARLRRRGRQPNIILLLTDDQDLLLGGTDRMPNLKRHLVNRGTNFTNAFVHTPICCPSRSSILSGRYLHNGVAINNTKSGNCNGELWRSGAEKSTFAVYAKAAGYTTFYAGKYLNAYDSGVPPGYDYWYGLVGNSRYYNYTIIASEDGGKTYRTDHHGDNYENDYLPDRVANWTLERIDQAIGQDKPFVSINSWPTPHGPFTPAPWAEHVFDGARAPRTQNWNASSIYMQQKHWMMRQLAPIDNATEDFIDTTYQDRLEALLSVDNHIAQIVELLERKGEIENTVIIYTSDHGFQLGQHRLAVDKRHLYEHDIRVPFIVATGDGVKKSSDDIVLNIDIAPTIYELTHGSSDIPTEMDGISFVPSLMVHEDRGKQNRSPRRDDFLVSYHGAAYGPCGMAECPPDPHGGWMPDGRNNTYHCVRALVDRGARRDEIYCRFEDDENFIEYYDLIIDPVQLVNRYPDLGSEEKDMFEARLLQLRKCRGESCRVKPQGMSLPVDTPVAMEQ